MRSLYECSKALVIDRTIVCGAGHELHARIGMKQLTQGDPLEVRVCQNCQDFDSMGPPVPKRDRGWQVKKDRVQRRKKPALSAVVEPSM